MAVLTRKKKNKKSSRKFVSRPRDAAGKFIKPPYSSHFPKHFRKFVSTNRKKKEKKNEITGREQNLVQPTRLRTHGEPISGEINESHQRAGHAADQKAKATGFGRQLRDRSESRYTQRVHTRRARSRNSLLARDWRPEAIAFALVQFRDKCSYKLRGKLVTDSQLPQSRTAYGSCHVYAASLRAEAFICG